MYSHRGTCSTTTPLTLLPIASTQYIRGYLAVTISIYINIVYKQVTNMAKDIQAMDYWLNKFKNSLSKIKNKLAFLKRSIITFIYNAKLPNIKYK